MHEVCYDEETAELRLQLANRYYNYCDVPLSMYRSLLSASSKGSYFNQAIKGRYLC
ncbi:KTSC domain-containing protein [Alteromonas oceanisediminis]|uniref:KTSC domain-containing protein n=1 Tax=Alteromonas oceanisediminis TaxID=2836180 RepID=UPI001BDA7AB1|nr:KTSC domain-containing protein [Alteromonas oceanisediminis]